MLEVLDGGERAGDLRELAHPAPDDGEVQDPATDVPGGEPQRPVPGGIGKRARTQEHVTAHRGALERQGGDERAHVSSAEEIAFEIVARAPSHRPKPDPEDDDVVEHEKENDRLVHDSSPSFSQLRERSRKQMV